MRSRWWRVTAVAGIVAGIGEAILGPSDPFFLAFAVLFFIGAALTLRGRLAGVVIVGLLSLIEVLFVPISDRESTSDWIVQLSFGVVAAVGLVAAVVVLLERRRSRSTATA